jgi:hypothetical protein
MASLSRGSNLQIIVDTASLRSVASAIKQAEYEMGGAARAVDKARNHENWRCNERHMVTNEIDLIKAHSLRIEKYLNRLSEMINKSAGEFENTQIDIISTLGDAELNTM